MPPKIRDDTGERYGSLTVLSILKIDGRHKRLCKCDCGNHTLVLRANLTSGRQVSCGCQKSAAAAARMRSRTPDETGNRYGRLVVIERAGLDRRSLMWRCRCDCGRETLVRGHRLRGGEAISCGCFASPRKPNPTGPEHHQWKAERVGYRALHMWLRKHKAKTGACSRCGAERYTEWANVAENREHSRDLDDYVEVCKPCHMRMDGHPWVAAGRPAQ